MPFAYIRPAYMGKITTVLLLLAWSVKASAGTVSGFVKDESGKPLAYASVYVKNGKSGTTTGVNGEYQLSLDAGQYTLVAQYVGYTKKE